MGSLTKEKREKLLVWSTFMSLPGMVAVVLVLLLFQVPSCQCVSPATAFVPPYRPSSIRACQHDFSRPAVQDDNTDAVDVLASVRELSRGAFLSAAAGALVTAAAASSNQAVAAESPAQAATTKAPPKRTVQQEKNQKTLEETISGFVAGGTLTVTKTVVKYPLDTATVRLQMPNSEYSIWQVGRLFDQSFRGITAPLLSNIPAGAVFFAVKDATKQLLKNNAAPMPRWASTSIAVLAASLPYWAVRNPSEVVKTRQQALVDGYVNVSAWQAFQNVRGNATTLGDLYLGYWENIAYGFPADVAKFVCYDALSGGRTNLSPAEGAVLGAASTALAQFVTTPLDVVRNRVMARTQRVNDRDSAEITSPPYVDTLVTLAREEGLSGLFAGVSPRVGKALLSGAIQFATYEETKQTIAKFFEDNANNNR